MPCDYKHFQLEGIDECKQHKKCGYVTNDEFYDNMYMESEDNSSSGCDISYDEYRSDEISSVI